MLIKSPPSPARKVSLKFKFHELLQAVVQQCTFSPHHLCPSLLPTDLPQSISTDAHLVCIHGIGGELICATLAVFLNDLHSFDPATQSWTDLSKISQGTVPSGRYGESLAASNGLLYTFGGRDNNGKAALRACLRASEAERAGTQR